jgi:ATPase
VIGKAGKNIDQIEKNLGMHIDVRTQEETSPGLPAPKMEETAKHIIIWLEGMAGEAVEVCLGDEPIFTATVGRRGDIRVAKSSEMAKRILKHIKKGEKIEVKLAEA